MMTREGIAELRDRLTTIRRTATDFFARAQAIQAEVQRYDDLWNDVFPPPLREQGEGIRTQIKRLSVDIAGAARGAPLIAEADLQDLRHHTRRMLASIHSRQYRHFGVYVHHDEDIVLGVDPPSQVERPVDVSAAYNLFEEAATRLAELIDLLSPAESLQTAATGTSTYRPNTAFIMMSIDTNNKELEDVKNGIKDVCKEFGISAVTADEIEHESVITDRILEEIETNEFLIADLTHERPNVYYELGHAHAKDKRVMLYCKKDTKLHFDVAHRNCPAYDNITHLKDLLRKRLETLTNKPRK